MTGAGSAIGRVTAGVLLEHGARVVVTDVVDAAARVVAVDLLDGGDSVVTVATDVSNPELVKRLVATTVERFGRLNIAHHNAGIELIGPDLVDTGRSTATPLLTKSERSLPRPTSRDSTDVELRRRFDHQHGFRSRPGRHSAPVGIRRIEVRSGGRPASPSRQHSVFRPGSRVNAVLPGVIQSPMVEPAVSENPASWRRCYARIRSAGSDTDAMSARPSPGWDRT